MIVCLLGDEPFPPGSEPGELGELRGRLLFLLETSKFYQAQHLLTHFPECESSFTTLCMKQNNKRKPASFRPDRGHTRRDSSRQNCRGRPMFARLPRFLF